MTKRSIKKAIKLIKSGKADKLHQARKILELELQTATEEDNLEIEISARYQLVRVLHAQGEFEAALRNFLENVMRLESSPAFTTFSSETIARVFRRRGNWDRAIAILEERVVNQRSIGYEDRATKTKLEIGHILQETGQIEEARSVYEWCLKRSKDSKNRQGVFDALMGLIEINFLVGEYFDTTKAINQAINLAEGPGGSLRLAQVMKTQALIEERKGAFKEAEKIYQACMGMLLKLDEQHSEQALGGALEEILSKIDYNEAFRKYEGNEEFRKTIDDIKFMILVIQRMGEVRLTMGSRNEAIEVFDKGLEIAERIWDLSSIANLLEAKARATLDQSIKDAESLAIQSLEISQNLGYPGEIATAFRTLGQVFRMKGDYSAAREHLRKAIDIRRSLGYGGGELCRDLWSLGEILHEIGSYAEAEVVLEEGFLIGERIDAKYEQALLLKSLGTLYYERGILESSIAFFEEAKGYFEQMGIANASVLLGLAKANLDSGNPEQTQWFFEMASGISSQQKDSRTIASCLLVASSISLFRGHLKDAEQIAYNVLKQTEKSQDFLLTVKGRLTLASIALQQAQNSLNKDAEDTDPFSFFKYLSQAGDFLDQSLDSAKRVGLLPVFIEVLIIKAFLDLMLSRFDSAEEKATEAAATSKVHGLFGHQTRADRLLERISEVRQKPVEMGEHFRLIEELIRPRRS